jgi:hypothetical protein
VMTEARWRGVSGAVVMSLLITRFLSDLCMLRRWRGLTT